MVNLGYRRKLVCVVENEVRVWEMMCGALLRFRL
jgi:hypothetical protein